MILGHNTKRRYEQLGIDAGLQIHIRLSVFLLCVPAAIVGFCQTLLVPFLWERPSCVKGP